MKTGPLELGEASNQATPAKLMFSGVAILEFILRILAAAGTLGSAMAMGTTEETIPLFPQSILLNAEYSDLPMFTFFVIANSVACAYLVLSLPLSFYHITRGAAKNSRIILVMFDTAMLALVTSGASTAAAIVYLAHKGNANANCICAHTDNHFLSRCYLPMLKFQATVKSASVCICLSAVCLILEAASSGYEPGSKNCSLRNERVPQFSATATGMPCSTSAASEVARNVVTSFLRFVITLFSWGGKDARIMGRESLLQR
ncbi:hypothetical protein CRYUN_Cryun06bG0169500 [Craigia yunnanensis]